MSRSTKPRPGTPRSAASSARSLSTTANHHHHHRHEGSREDPEPSPASSFSSVPSTRRPRLTGGAGAVHPHSIPLAENNAPGSAPQSSDTAGPFGSSEASTAHRPRSSSTRTSRGPRQSVRGAREDGPSTSPPLSADALSHQQRRSPAAEEDTTAPPPSQLQPRGAAASTSPYAAPPPPITTSILLRTASPRVGSSGGASTPRVRSSSSPAVTQKASMTPHHASSRVERVSRRTSAATSASFPRGSQEAGQRTPRTPRAASAVTPHSSSSAATTTTTTTPHNVFATVASHQAAQPPPVSIADRDWPPSQAAITSPLSLSTSPSPVATSLPDAHPHRLKVTTQTPSTTAPVTGTNDGPTALSPSLSFSPLGAPSSSLQRRSTSRRSSLASASVIRPSHEVLAQTRPWLLPAPIRGILKTTKARGGQTRSSKRPNADVANASLSADMDHSELKASGRITKRVQFDEENLQASGCGSSQIYADATLGFSLGSVGLDDDVVATDGTPVGSPSSELRPSMFSGPATGRGVTTATRHADPSTGWDDDSEWFNEQFGLSAVRTGRTGGDATPHPPGLRMSPSPVSNPTLSVGPSSSSSHTPSPGAAAAAAAAAAIAASIPQPRRTASFGGEDAEALAASTLGNLTSPGTSPSSSTVKPRPYPTTPRNPRGTNASLVATAANPPARRVEVSLEQPTVLSASPSKDQDKGAVLSPPPLSVTDLSHRDGPGTTDVPTDPSAGAALLSQQGVAQPPALSASERRLLQALVRVNQRRDQQPTPNAAPPHPTSLHRPSTDRPESSGCAIVPPGEDPSNRGRPEGVSEFDGSRVDGEGRSMRAPRVGVVHTRSYPAARLSPAPTPTPESPTTVTDSDSNLLTSPGSSATRRGAPSLGYMHYEAPSNVRRSSIGSNENSLSGILSASSSGSFRPGRSNVRRSLAGAGAGTGTAVSQEDTVANCHSGRTSSANHDRDRPDDGARVLPTTVVRIGHRQPSPGPAPSPASSVPTPTAEKSAIIAGYAAAATQRQRESHGKHLARMHTSPSDAREEHDNLGHFGTILNTTVTQKPVDVVTPTGTDDGEEAQPRHLVPAPTPRLSTSSRARR